jgi:hypothetical protein
MDTPSLLIMFGLILLMISLFLFGINSKEWKWILVGICSVILFVFGGMLRNNDI